MRIGALALSVLFGSAFLACGEDEESADRTGAGSAGTPTGGTTGRGGGAGTATGGQGGAAGSAGASGVAGSDAGGQAFPSVLYQGVWFAGWSGGLDHYSWVKFSPSSPGATNGTWAAVDPSCVTCTRLLPCAGRDGLFSATPATRTIVMQYPLACSDSGAPGSETWTVRSISQPSGSPPGAELVLAIGVEGRASIDAYRYPASHCDAGFTSCPGPW